MINWTEIISMVIIIIDIKTERSNFDKMPAICSLLI